MEKNDDNLLKKYFFVVLYSVGVLVVIVIMFEGEWDMKWINMDVIGEIGILRSC